MSQRKRTFLSPESKKQNIGQITEKWDLICQKSYYKVDKVIKTRETTIILNQLL